MYGSFGATGDDSIGHTVLDSMERLAYRVGTRSAGCHHRQTGALGVMTDSDVTRGDIGYHCRDKEGRDATCTLIEILSCLAHKGRDSTDTRAYVYAEASRVDVLTAHQSAILHGLVGCHYGILAIEVHLAYVGALQPSCYGVKVLHLRYDAHGEVYIVKSLDKIQSTLTLNKTVPEVCNSVSYGADSSQSCNYDFSFHL